MTKKSSSRRRVRASKRRQTANSFWAFAIPIAVGVIVLALVVGAIWLNEDRRARAAAASAPTSTLSVPVITTAPQATAPIPYPGVARISLKETQTLLDKGEAVLIDVRGKESYDQSHAAGALSLPEEEILARLNEVPRDKMLILYCT